jgi:3-mercaptopyruvate sulfurtransferase SseA
MLKMLLVRKQKLMELVCLKRNVPVVISHTKMEQALNYLKLETSGQLVEQKKVTVLDTRELLQTDQKTPNYAAGHIPGALPFPYSNLRGPKEAPGAVLPIAQ